MKKIILCLVLAFVSFAGFSQDSTALNFSGKAVAYMYDELKDDKVISHHDWAPLESDIYVYVDWKMGFCAINNKFYNRFMFLQKLSSEKTSTGELVKIKVVDQNYVICELHFLFRNDKSFDIKVTYNNIIYEYKVGYVEQGYPYKLLSTPEQETKQPIKSII